MAGLPSRKAEWDKAIADMGRDFEDAYTLTHGRTLAERTDPVNFGKWEIAEAHADWYDLAAERISREPLASMRIVVDEHGEDRWLACSPEVNRGGFGRVVLADRPADGFSAGTTPRMALKIALPGKTLDDPVLDAPVPGIAAPFARSNSREIGASKPEQTLLMDGYVKSLDAFMGHRFRPSDVATLFATMDQGLHDARLGGRAVVHTDLKPDNILVGFDPETKQAIYAITDLGLLRAAGTMCAGDCTPEYAPVDQPNRPASTKMDSFAAAAIGYEMLSGQQFRSDIIIPVTGKQIDVRKVAMRHESGFRALPGQESWERILADGYDPDPERRCDLTALAARSQAYLTSEQERSILRPADMERYTDFLCRDRNDHDRFFAGVDREAADALIRDTRLPDSCRSRLVAARRQMIDAPRPEADERVVALSARENECRAAQIQDVVQRLKDAQIAAVPKHSQNGIPAGRQSLAQWEAQKRTETARGPPRGPTR